MTSEYEIPFAITEARGLSWGRSFLTHALCARPLNHFARQREFGPELRTICRRLTHAEGMISIARPAQCGRPTFRAEHAGAPRRGHSLPGGRGRRVGLYAGEVGTGHHPRLPPPDGFSPAACERFRIALVDTARSLPDRPAMPSCGLARGGSNRPMAVTDRSMTGRAPGAPVSPGDHCRAVRALARHLRFHRRCNQSGVSAGTDYARTCPDRGGPR